jgi:hypothetical protein
MKGMLTVTKSGRDAKPTQESILSIFNHLDIAFVLSQHVIPEWMVMDI